MIDMGFHRFLIVIIDAFVKSHRSCRDGLWKKLDILDVASETVIRQYIWYG
jgi:hypothetical protein